MSLLDAYLERGRASLADFQRKLGALAGSVGSGEPDPPRITEKHLETLRDLTARLGSASEALRHSFEQIGSTGPDLVDLQARLEGESASVASALASLGKIVNRQHFVRRAFGEPLMDLEEAAGRLASATFPNTIDGLGDINRALWDFHGRVWIPYQRVFADEVGRGKIPLPQLDRIEETARDVRDRFQAVDDLLNNLAAVPAGDADVVRDLIHRSKEALESALRLARSRAAPVYKPFHGALKEAEKMAGRIPKLFSKLKIPIFPDFDRMADLHPAIDEARYRGLSGVERFALLNIASRLRSIRFGAEEEHLLSPRFEIRVFDVFPDRIYFSAASSFIDTVEQLVKGGVFDEAPASLHRFNEGSVKQSRFARGNLQLSYARVKPFSEEAPRYNVDADIDLYRSPVRHLFGEVLVNHLTGKRTDQFKVMEALVATNTPTVGDFSVITV